ncbi:glycine--tRNA ligase subunit beta [Sandarakinorhabdus sp.]|uniref:glycine--tRNA ligase subunit beta n=1 Tax=Sandarakinorhabdus sp. TaxID=1916663 RepID=UPI00286DB933|nr:glycine--tRNA ligase subunit beta [Sandarakinorhabdus sp.]
MSAFLLEILSEEIPARMQVAAAEQLRTRFEAGMKAAGLAHGVVTADATPRRLWLIAGDVAAASQGSAEEVKGPRADAPAQAIDGFLKKTGLTREQLEERDTGKGVVLFAVLRREGRAASAILSDLVPQIIADFAWPKSMRWGSAPSRWVRPLSGIVALLDGDVVTCAAHGLTAGRETRGHRIHALGPISITSPESYADQLRAAFVEVHSGTRQQLISQAAAAAAGAQGLTILPDEGLVRENAGLTEWPVPLLGRFDPAFLTVPPEVIQLTMRTNQKYFACADATGALAPAFVCVANLVASDGGAAIVAGNERVLSARLSDAQFFWEQDLAVVKAGGLEAFLPKLDSIVFHEKLGTVADKVARVEALATWLAESGAIPSPLEGEGDSALSPSGVRGVAPADPSPRSPLASRPLPQGEREALAALAARAARLAKADLVSATVGEFPELQGVIGRYLALAGGEDPAVADALRDHYKPVGQGDDVPTAPISTVMALADKLDTLCAFFAYEMIPTGSKDPFALRRAALGILSICLTNNIRLPMFEVARLARDLTGGTWERTAYRHAVNDFFADRLKVQQREAGVRHDLIDAVFALGGEDDFVRLLARVHALQAFVTSDEGANLLAGYKRAANILKAAEKDGAAMAASAGGTGEGAETALAAALDAALPAAATAVAQERFTDAMTALASLRAPVDAFFTDVMVNDPDPGIRARRLALLARFRDAVHGVADFSRIEG